MTVATSLWPEESSVPTVDNGSGQIVKQLDRGTRGVSSDRMPISTFVMQVVDPNRVRRFDVYRALFVVADSTAAMVAVALAGGSAFGAVAFVAATAALDLFERHRAERLHPSALDDIPVLAVRGLVTAWVCAWVGLSISGDRVPGAFHAVGPFFTALLFTAIAAVGRGAGYAMLRRLHRAGRLCSPALIVGMDPVGLTIGQRLLEHPEYGLVPVGYVDTAVPDPASGLPAPVLGTVTDLPALIAEHGVRHVFVAFSRTGDEDLVNLVRRCCRLDCEIFVVPRLFESGGGGAAAVDHLWGVRLIRLDRAVHLGYAWRLKRVLDFAVAAVLLVLSSPLMLAVALAVRRELGPPVLFRQERVGLDGRRFQMLKFRTLRPRRVGRPAQWSVVEPDQVGPVGRLLRRSSLDELPQLWNVLRGQMSLVGPRPEQPHYARQFSSRYPGYEDRLRVPAGVTGLAQVHDLRGATCMEDRVCFDNFYIEHWSFWRDVKILVHTAASVIRMRGG
jgi:exopolysaccharide biosynthesis polyprenyl glycosylphosphotransferase